MVCMIELMACGMAAPASCVFPLVVNIDVAHISGRHLGGQQSALQAGRTPSYESLSCSGYYPFGYILFRWFRLIRSSFKNYKLNDDRSSSAISRQFSISPVLAMIDFPRRLRFAIRIQGFGGSAIANELINPLSDWLIQSQFSNSWFQVLIEFPVIFSLMIVLGQ